MDEPTVRWDPEVDAAYIAFRKPDPGEASHKFQVPDKNGDISLLVRITESGEILGLELLNAESQMPRIYRSLDPNRKP